MKSKNSITPKSKNTVKRFLDGVPSTSVASSVTTSAKRGAKQVNLSADTQSEKHLGVPYPDRSYPGIERLRNRAYPAERHYAGLSPELFERAYSGRSYPGHRGYPGSVGIPQNGLSAKHKPKAPKKRTK